MAQEYYYETSEGERTTPVSPASILGNFIAFTAAYMVAGWGSKVAAGALVKKFTSLKGDTLGSIAGNLLKKQFPSIGSSYIGQTIARKDNAYTKWMGRWRTNEQTYNKLNFDESTRRLFYGTSDREMAARFNYTRGYRQVADFFSKPGFRQRAAGLGVHAAKKTLQGMGGIYAVDYGLGLINRRDEMPAIYDIPGHIGAFAKMTAANAPFTLLMGGGWKVFPHAGRGLIGGIAGVREATNPHVIEGALARVSQGTQWISRQADRFGNALRMGAKEGRAQLPRGLPFMEYFKRGRGYGQAARQFWEGTKGAWQKHHFERQGVISDETMHMLISMASAKSGQEYAMETIALKSRAGEVGAFQYALGLRNQKAFGSIVRNERERALKMATQGMPQEKLQDFTRQFNKQWLENAKSIDKLGLVFERGLYQSSKGQLIDTRLLEPGLLFKKVLRGAADLQFRIPGIGILQNSPVIKPFRILPFADMLTDPFYQEMTGNVFVGGTPTTGPVAPGMMSGLVLNDPAGKAGGILYHGADILKASGASGPRSFFAGKSYFNVTDGHITAINPRTYYKLINKPEDSWSTFLDTLAAMSGVYPSKVKEERGALNWAARMLDYEPSSGGIASRMKRYFFTAGSPSPVHLVPNIKAYGDTTQIANQEMIGFGILSGMKRMARDSTVGFSRRMSNEMRAVLLHNTGVDVTKLGSLEYMQEQAYRIQEELQRAHPFVRHMADELNFSKNITRMRSMTSLADQTKFFSEPTAAGTVYDSFADMLLLHNMAKGQSEISWAQRLSSEIAPAGFARRKTNKWGMTTIRNISLGLQLFKNTTNIEKMLSKFQGGPIDDDMVKNVVNLLDNEETLNDIRFSVGKMYKNPFAHLGLLDNDPHFIKNLENTAIARGMQQANALVIPWGESSIQPWNPSIITSGKETSYTNDAGTITPGKFMWATTMRRFTRLFDLTNMGLDPSRYKGGGAWENFGGAGTQMLVQGVVARRALPIAAAMTAYGVLDRLVDAFPGLGNTPLGEGLTVFGADQFVKLREGIGLVNDYTGVTSTMNYMENLFPGSISSPASGAIRGLLLPLLLTNRIGMGKGSGGSRLAWGALAGFGLSAWQGFGMFDMTKDHKELEDLYSGRQEVPVRKGRWWELSSSNYLGGRIKSWVPNWYARLKSQYMSTPDGWGSPMEQIMHKPWPLIDFNPVGWALGGSHHYAYQHYYSRPYPETGTAFYEVPFMGPALAATLGRVVAPPQRMHEEELYGQLDKYGYGVPGGLSERMVHNPTSTEMASAMPVSKFSVRQTAANQLYEMEQMAGLWGFSLQTATSALMGMEQPYRGDNVLEDARDITSMSRQYYDKELGGLLGFSEVWRRFLPKRATPQNRVNPLQNRMPKWLPVQFRLGDAYAHTPMGELVLPGMGYSTAHDVNMTFPVAADMLGLGVEDTTRRMLSLGRPEPIGREEIERINRRITAAAEVYEPYNDVSGTYDGVIRKGRRSILQKIKNFSSQDLNGLAGPRDTDISEINFYMRMSGIREGVIQYNMDNMPILALPVTYDEQRYQKDMTVIARARRKAAYLYANGVGFEGEAYSHMDRAHILSNVAPYSDEFKRELSMAQQEVKIGRGDKERLERIKYQARSMKMGQEFYPRRFLGHVLTPQAKYTNMSLNPNLKAAAEYSLPERAVGAVWEMANSFAHPFDKFHYYKSPLDAYKQQALYGRGMKMWQEPIDNWAESYMRGFLSKDGPVSGALAGFLGGYAFSPFSGPISAGVGAVIGATYGSAHGMYRAVTGTKYIPGSIKQIRNISGFFDNLKYQKMMMAYGMTGDDTYLEEAQSTMAGLNAPDLSRESFGRFYRATPYMERPYVMAFMKEADPTERANILDVVPKSLGDVLSVKWARMDGAAVDFHETRRAMKPLMPPTWAGWAPGVELDDIELKTVENEGFLSHDFGLGWDNQQRRIQNSSNLPGPINMSNPMRTRDNVPVNNNMAEVRRMIERVLNAYGTDGYVSVVPNYSDNSITVIS